MTVQDLPLAIKETECFQKYESFKKKLTLCNKNIVRLHDLYGQAERLGIDYLKQNPYLMSTDIRLIDELLKNKNK